MRSCINARLRLLGDGSVLPCAKLSCAIEWGVGGGGELGAGRCCKGSYYFVHCCHLKRVEKCRVGRSRLEKSERGWDEFDLIILKR